jgi:hypothetical protein
MTEVPLEYVEFKLRGVNQGKVLVEMWDKRINQMFYVSPPIVSPLYKRLLKEQPFMAFILIRPYTITAEIKAIQSDGLVIEWSYVGPETFKEVETHHPLLWQVSIEKLTASVTE